METDGFEQLKNQIQEWLQEAEQLILQIPKIQLYTAIGVVLLPTFLFLLDIDLTILQLRDGSFHQGTVTSMEPNEGTFVLHYEMSKKGKIKPVHIVDVPGHSRLRPKLDEFLPQAAGIVFVVDALQFLPNCRAASDDKLRTSRTALSAADIANEYSLGVPGEAFAFSQCQNKVTVTEASGLTGEISQLDLFIREHVKA
ncbi:signal recognition particle binding protein [Actinidia rufa]|uniref:Signal recognition particle receptor subunit beta n=1 Tax=Actinidia rufa TaxID=165716 RepID=A0A7J0FPH4_9ERIC|nr:signal recognition particle binding protein [Actinidia rufa]